MRPIEGEENDESLRVDANEFSFRFLFLGNVSLCFSVVTLMCFRCLISLSLLLGQLPMKSLRKVLLKMPASKLLDVVSIFLFVDFV
jgi:hypothetical protein